MCILYIYLICLLSIKINGTLLNIIYVQYKMKTKQKRKANETKQIENKQMRIEKVVFKM